MAPTGGMLSASKVSRSFLAGNSAPARSTTARLVSRARASVCQPRSSALRPCPRPSIARRRVDKSAATSLPSSSGFADDIAEREEDSLAGSIVQPATATAEEASVAAEETEAAQPQDLFATDVWAWRSMKATQIAAFLVSQRETYLLVAHLGDSCAAASVISASRRPVS